MNKRPSLSLTITISKAMHIEEEYAQRASAVSSLRAILDAYPLSIGIFRELLQNSDDAGASKQIFVLDHRIHPHGSLYDPGLAKTQGPALLAFNDAVLQPADWDALGSMHDSSKSDDESKIGKYGVGFRSVFNITDSPQIVSDKYLAIFDPLCLCLGSEGKKIDLGYVISKCPDQISPFDFFTPDGSMTSPFIGTAMRCPLRSTEGRLSAEVITIDTISRLFDEFVDQELGISLLFLQNIKLVEIHEILPNGTSTLRAKVTMTSRLDPNTADDHSTALRATVTLESITNQEPQIKEWYIVHSDFPRDEAIRILSKQPGYLVSTLANILKGAKFSPEIKVAADMTTPTRGRIFTYLPLPIFTGFPVHIHGLFGIDSSRRHLRAEDIGLQSGTRDHTTVEWNKLLFQIFIPRAWRFVLEHMVSSGQQVSSMFDYWPPQSTVGEVNAYAASLPQHILDTVLSTKSPIWPLYDPRNGTPEFRDLDLLVVAPPSAADNLLRALVIMGVSLTRPPKYIYELLAKSSHTVTILSPEVIHDALLANIDGVVQSADDDKDQVLGYLLSTKNVANIRGLPLVPVANCTRVALSSHATGGMMHTILTRSQFDVFGTCDDLAIPMRCLPPKVAEVLLESGPGVLNVQALAIPRIVEYVTQYSTRSGLCLPEEGPRQTALRWFSSFWTYLGSHEQEAVLFLNIRSLLVLPSTKGLRTAEAPLFKHRDEHPVHTRAYSSIGVPFLAHELSDAAHTVLHRYGLIRLVSDVPSLLDLVPQIPPPSPPPRPEFIFPDILKHLANHMPKPTAEIVQKLRRLPIFPVLSHSSAVPQWGPIPEGVSIRSVGKPSFIPVVEGLIFVDLDTYAPAIVSYLEPEHYRPLSDGDIVALAVMHMTTQDQRLQLAVLRYISRGRSRIPPVVIDNLCAQAFVDSEDDRRLRSPVDLVDPESDLAALYSRKYFPARSTPTEQEKVKHLRTLGLLKATITLEIVRERIQFISTNALIDPESVNFSRHLLSLLERSNLDFSQIQGIAEQKWLPTNGGLCSASECRHSNLVSPSLFNRVLATLEGNNIPPSLQTALGWDDPLPLNLIIEQLDALLTSSPNYDDVVEIVKEFGRREWDDVELANLEKVTRNRSWIPTSVGTLADIRSAVLEFSPTMVNSGFHQIRMDLKADELFRRMGCTDHPSTKAIIEKLHVLAEESTAFDPVGVSLSLLRCLPDEITNLERSKLLIPDSSSVLRPFQKVFYNDIGENSRLLGTECDFIAHHLVDDAFARKLGLARLGLSFAELRDLGPNLGQAPITTVRENLRRYTEQQFLLEFIANAEDARATEFAVALNLVTLAHKHDLRVLSPDMAYLCKLPSLVVYNNARFSQQDFEGICRTSIGGKEGRPDTIGEFGLGALTMYHFTDVAMVISGSQVLFMDPSKKHLPIPEHASLTLPLRRVQQFYRDHLEVLDGMFGFDISSDTYEGTLFILPLRSNANPSCPEFIVDSFWPTDRLSSEILDPFKKSAANCLLFTRLEQLTYVVRKDESSSRVSWSFLAARTQPIVDDIEGFEVREVGITDSTTTIWKVATRSLAKDQLPEEFVTLSLRRDPFAGLAIPLGRVSPPGNETRNAFKFFSSLPLSTTTSLPMHIMASFLLSSDRRQIRLDGYQKSLTKFNEWLLKQLIPPLYLFFLEHLLSTEVEDFYKRWPRPKETGATDHCSQHVVDGFRAQLGSSRRRVFQGRDSFLTPQEVVLSGNEPRKIRQALGLLGSPVVIKLPEALQKVADVDGIAQVTPVFIREEILRNPTAMTAEVDCDLIEEVIIYLTSDAGSPTLLNDLAILPLQDDTFGTLCARGTGPSYFVWKPKDNLKGHNFPENWFLHPKMKTKELLCLPVNVQRLDVMSIIQLVEVQLSAYSDLQQFQWIDSFWSSWDEYSALGLTYPDISSYPLVPTTQPLTFVSIDHCKEGAALLMQVKSPEDRVLQEALQALGVMVVRIDSEQTPEALRSILGRNEFPGMSFENVLSALAQTGEPITELLTSIEGDLRNEFASWARTNVPSHLSETHLSFARELPIWWSAGNGAMRGLRAASNVWLLPQGLTHKIAAKFMSVCVADDVALRGLQPQTLSFQDLNARLLLPDELDEEDLQPYKRFFGVWVEHLPNSFKEPIRVPTTDRSVRYSNELYARSPLFEAILPPDSSQFIHPEFAAYEEILYGRGLRREEDFNVDIFVDCVGTLDVADPNSIERARELFHAYSEILPIRVDPQNRDVWSERLGNLAFVPRRMETKRNLGDQVENATGLAIPPNVTELRAIVEPGELVKEKYEPIAWSQRGCFEVQPERVLLVYPDLGRPSFTEVVEHLSYLSDLRPVRMADRRILLHDVQKTYQYLDENISLLFENEALGRQIVSRLQQVPLFLNIRDIGNVDDQLNWVKGDDLAVDAGNQSGSIQDVGGFLLPFGRLLSEAGVLRVHHPQVGLGYADMEGVHETEKLQGMWSGFNRLRRENALTDVAFVTASTELEPLYAHRCFLAAFSEYFKDLFCGNFRDSRNHEGGNGGGGGGSGNHQIMRIEDVNSQMLRVKIDHYSRDCMESVLSYIYTGTCPAEDDTALNLLLEILDLSNYLHILDLFQETQWVIVSRRYINPDTVDSIRDTAERFNAEDLLGACEEYADHNQDFIQKVRQGRQA